MRTLILLDNKSKGKESRVIASMEKIKADYGGDVVYTIQHRDFANVKWVYYDSKAKGIDFSYLQETNKEIYKEHGLEYDNVIYCVDPVNWQDGEVAVGGWNIGGKFNNFYPQIVKVMNSDEWLYKAFAMEIIHMMDDICWLETGVNLNRMFKDEETGQYLDFDYDLIHGENKKYGKYVKGTPQESWTKTDYYTDYNFEPVIKDILPYFREALAVRRKKFDNFIEGLKKQISIIQAIIEIYRQLALLRKPKASPIYMSELSGHSH